jgi:CheY-like chemotaxis protein
MTLADVLVLEPDYGTCDAVRQALTALQYHVVVSGSLADAVRRTEQGDLEVMIADWRALIESRVTPLDSLSLANQLRVSMARLRAVHEGAPPRPRTERTHPLKIIVTARVADAPTHAAAISAGADAYLREDDLREPGVLGSYLTRLLEQMWIGVDEARSPEDSASQTTPEALRAAHVTDAFSLPDADLRDDASGRWDATKIADALGVSLREFAGMLEANYTTVHKTPNSVALQERMAPFANILAMTRGVLAGDMTRVRKWLNQPQPRLGGLSPLGAMRTPGQAPAVEQWIVGEGE